MEILIATQNAGKVREMTKLLEGLPIILRNLRDFENIAEPEETGSTFLENAVLKAEYYSLQTNLPALADDSGLEVEALGGAPGIFSARYAGSDATDAERTVKLLAEIEKTGDEKRLARFVCAAALTDEKGRTIQTALGICDGKIAFAPRGANGFGYDPVFIPAGFSQTFAEISASTKQQISHRARALEKIIEFLRGFYAA
jgi:XTP/dITP diphosphohydrolase